MTRFALASSRASTAVDIYRTRAEAEKELQDAFSDEPAWTDVLSVVELELPEPDLN
jgi:ssRNA-specific RNase YbeY (16S rRNA maturation enzyme)